MNDKKYTFDENLRNDDNFSSESVDVLISGRSRILASKLEVFASEIWSRLDIRRKHKDSIYKEQEKSRTLLDKLVRLVQYGFAHPTEKENLERQIFTLNQEARREDLDAWKDLVFVMRDFLNVWEAYEQAKVRGRFLNAG